MIAVCVLCVTAVRVMCCAGEYMTAAAQVAVFGNVAGVLGIIVYQKYLRGVSSLCTLPSATPTLRSAHQIDLFLRCCVVVGCCSLDGALGDNPGNHTSIAWGTSGSHLQVIVKWRSRSCCTRGLMLKWAYRTTCS